MVNPNKITNYKLNKHQLEEQLLFWIAVAGKTAKTIAPRIYKVLRETHHKFDYGKWRPFKVIEELGERGLAEALKRNGIGCYKGKARAMYSLATSGLDPKTCSLDDLITIPGIGLKTASCFIMHSRPNAQVAGLDTHVLKFLNHLGFNVSETTPQSKRKYEEISDIFLELARRANRTPADLDLLVWRVYSKHPHLERILLRYFISRGMIHE